MGVATWHIQTLPHHIPCTFWVGLSLFTLEYGGGVVYFGTHSKTNTPPKSNTYKRLPIINTLLPWIVPHGGSGRAHGMTSLGPLVAPPHTQDARGRFCNRTGWNYGGAHAGVWSSLDIVPNYGCLVLGNEGGGPHHMQGRHTRGLWIGIRKLHHLWYLVSYTLFVKGYVM